MITTAVVAVVEQAPFDTVYFTVYEPVLLPLGVIEPPVGWSIFKLNPEGLEV